MTDSTGEAARPSTTGPGLARGLALATAVLAVCVYLLGFTDGVSVLVSDVPGALLLGGGLLTMVSILPGVRWLLAPAAVISVVGALQVVQKTATTATSLSAMGIVAVLLCVLLLLAAGGALLVDHDLLGSSAKGRGGLRLGRLRYGDRPRFGQAGPGQAGGGPTSAGPPGSGPAQPGAYHPGGQQFAGGHAPFPGGPYERQYGAGPAPGHPGGGQPGQYPAGQYGVPSPYAAGGYGNSSYGPGHYGPQFGAGQPPSSPRAYGYAPSPGGYGGYPPAPYPPGGYAPAGYPPGSGVAGYGEPAGPATEQAASQPLPTTSRFSGSDAERAQAGGSGEEGGPAGAGATRAESPAADTSGEEPGQASPAGPRSPEDEPLANQPTRQLPAERPQPHPRSDREPGGSSS